MQNNFRDNKRTISDKAQNRANNINMGIFGLTTLVATFISMPLTKNPVASFFLGVTVGALATKIFGVDAKPAKNTPKVS